MQIKHKSHLHTLLHKIEVVEESWKPFIVGNLKRKFVYILPKKVLRKDVPFDLYGVTMIDSIVQQLDQWLKQYLK